MSVLIKGIFGKERPIPQEGYIDVRLHIRGGRIECATMQTGNPPFYATFKVVEIPPHGRLIDADRIDFRNDAMHDGYGRLIVNNTFTEGVMWVNRCINEAPTVIETEDKA